MLLSFSNETSSEAFLFPDILRLTLTKSWYILYERSNV